MHSSQAEKLIDTEKLISIENSKKIAAAINQILLKIPSAGTSQETVQLMLNQQVSCDIRITVPHLEKIVPSTATRSNDEALDFEPVLITISHNGQEIARRSVFFDRISNVSLLETSTFVTDENYQGHGLARGLLSVSDILIDKIRKIHPTVFAEATIISLFQDTESPDFVSAQTPLKKSWGDSVLRQLGYAFDAKSVIEAIPSDTLDFDQSTTPYQSRVKTYAPEIVLDGTKLSVQTNETNEQPVQSVLIPEMIRGTQYYNLSGQPIEVLLSKLPFGLEAQQVTFLPDFSPAGDVDRLPTGCSVVLDTVKNPEWRKFAISDVGCGMSVLESGVTWAEFDQHKEKWDQVAAQLKVNQDRKGSVLGDLGGGNHFVDAVVDDKGKVYFVIHTGSRDESPKATDLVHQPAEFDAEYQRIIKWAQSNRAAIGVILEQIYGPLKREIDQVHNFYEFIPGTNLVVIYKGAVKLLPGQRTIIPSSMTRDMQIVEGTTALKDIYFAMSHGTGRRESRSAMRARSPEEVQKEIEEVRGLIYVPAMIQSLSIKTDLPTAYRDIDECLPLIEGLVQKQQRLYPIAYIGNI